MTEIFRSTDDEFWNQLALEDQKGRRGKAKNVSKEYLETEKLYGNLNVQIPKRGSIINARYIGLFSDQHCFVVNGYKDYVRVDNRPSENKYLKNLHVDDNIDILISSINNDNFYIKGSVAEIYENRAHETLKALDEDLVVVAFIRSLTPAGYDVDVIHDGVTLPGFMPNTLAGINKLHDQESIVGKSLEVMIESFSREEGTYIVSRRKYLRTLIPVAIGELEYNTVYTGHVTGTTPFGIFIEFNDCLTGMVHKANVTEEWSNRLSEIRPGTEIEFYVKEIIKDKIILTQILRETLWDTIKNGQVLDGRVKEEKQFGTLIILDDETIGLIHTSEMEKLGRRFTPNQDIKVKVLAVDRSSRKIFLTVS